MQSPPHCSFCGAATAIYRKGCTDIEYHTTTDEYAFYECRQCQLIRISPMPTALLPIIYPANYYSYQSPGNGLAESIKKWLDKRLFKKILSPLKGNLSVLDVGGGTGWLLGLARSVCLRVTFTQVADIDAHAEQAARQNGHEYFHGRIEDFESSRSFDLVLLLNLIEHVEDPLQVLSKIKALLTDQGIVLIKTPNYDSLDASLFRNWGGLHCPRHWSLFTRHSIQLLAYKAGLKVKSVSYTQGAPFWAVSILGMMQKRKWISVSAARPAVAHPLYPVLLCLFAAFDLLRKPFARTSQMFVVLTK